MFEALMLEILAFALWTFFVAYATWYLTLAKYNVPISVDEARLLWKIHKQSSRCSAKKWREVEFNGKVVGFECACGYKHVQRRLIVASPPTLQIETQNDLRNKLTKSRASTRLQRR